jgi:hypothetical protein
MKAIFAYETSGTTYPLTQRHISEELISVKNSKLVEFVFGLSKEKRPHFEDRIIIKWIVMHLDKLDLPQDSLNV